jgi:hypothetical protein
MPRFTIVYIRLTKSHSDLNYKRQCMKNALDRPLLSGSLMQKEAQQRIWPHLQPLVGQQSPHSIARTLYGPVVLVVCEVLSTESKANGEVPVRHTLDVCIILGKLNSSLDRFLSLLCKVKIRHCGNHTWGVELYSVQRSCSTNTSNFGERSIIHVTYSLI